MFLTDASVTLASGCGRFFAKSTAFTSEKHPFEQFLKLCKTLTGNLCGNVQEK